MTLAQAMQRASARARKVGDWRYVVRTRNEFGDIDHEIASDFDCDTFYAGDPVVASFGPDGQPEIDS